MLGQKNTFKKMRKHRMTSASVSPLTKLCCQVNSINSEGCVRDAGWRLSQDEPACRQLLNTRDGEPPSLREQAALNLPKRTSEMYSNTPSTCDKFTQQEKQTSEQRRQTLLGSDKHTRMRRARDGPPGQNTLWLFSGVNMFGAGDAQQGDQK